jgi:F-type H+-transporting ATPase subunit b
MRITRAFSFAVSGLLISLPALAQEAVQQAPEAAHEGGSTMPQLDPTWYASQVFWLVICGGFLYLVMSKIALPRISKVLTIRDDQVRHDLERAARLKQEAEDIKVVYTRALRDADERAKSLTDRTISDLRAKQNEALAKVTLQANDRLAKTEQTIATQKNTVLGEVDAVSKQLSDAIIKELGKKAA